jgi:hypothetical protein
MARSKPSARDALKKLREQRLELDAQEVRLRDEAATELGKMLVECGAETIEPAQLKRVVQASMALGIDETLKRLTAKYSVTRGGKHKKGPDGVCHRGLVLEHDDQSSSMSGAPSLLFERPPLVRKSTLSAMISQP